MDFFEDINTNKVKTDYITNKPTGSNSVKNGFWFDPLSKTIMVSKNLDSDEPTWCEVATKCDIPLRFDITHHYYSASKYNYVFVYNYTKTYRYGYPYIYTYTYRYNYDWFFYFSYNYYYDIVVHTYHRYEYEYKYGYPYTYTYGYSYNYPYTYRYRYSYSYDRPIFIPVYYSYSYSDTVFIPVHYSYEYPYTYRYRYSYSYDRPIFIPVYYSYSYSDTVFIPVHYSYEYPYTYRYRYSYSYDRPIFIPVYYSYSYSDTVFIPVHYRYEYEYEYWYPYEYPYPYPYEYSIPYFYNLSYCYCEPSEITEQLHIPFTQDVEYEFQTLEREGTVMDHVLTTIQLTADHMVESGAKESVIKPLTGIGVVVDSSGYPLAWPPYPLRPSNITDIQYNILANFEPKSLTYNIEYKTEDGTYRCYGGTIVDHNRSLANKAKVFSENPDGSFGYYNELPNDNLISITEPDLLSDDKSSDSEGIPREYYPLSLLSLSEEYISEIEQGSEECSCSLEFTGTKTNHTLTITAYGYGQVGFHIRHDRNIEYYDSTGMSRYSEVETAMQNLSWAPGSTSGIDPSGDYWKCHPLRSVSVGDGGLHTAINLLTSSYAKMELTDFIPAGGFDVSAKVSYPVDKYSEVTKTRSTTISGTVDYIHKYTTDKCSCVELSPSEVMGRSNDENGLVALKAKNFEPYPHKIVYTPIDRESSHYSFLILAESKGLVVKQLNDSYYQVNNLKVTVVSGQWSGDGMQIPSAKTGTVFDVKGFSKTIPFYKDLYAVVKPTLKYGKVISVSDVELVEVEQLKSMIFNNPAFKIVGKLEINDATKECLPVQYTTSNLIYPFNFGIEIPFCLNQKTKDSNDDFATFEALGGTLQVVDKDNTQIGSFDIGNFEIDLTEEQLNAGGYVCLKVKFKLIDGKPTKLKSYKVKFHSSESSIAKNINSGKSLASKTGDTFTDIIPLSKVQKNSVTPVLIKGFEHLNSGRLILRY